MKVPVTWITIDPGETVGWAIWQDGKRVEAGQTKMWEFIDALDEWAVPGGGISPIFKTEWDGYGPVEAVDGRERKRMVEAPLNWIVMEDWILYEWEAQNLVWNRQRTVRAIGAIELIARQNNIPLELQGADIKDAAKAAGAEELFLSPVHENRHANDATMHGVFYLARKGVPGRKKNGSKG